MIFKALYPNSETNKEIVITSSVTGLLLYLLLIIYQPFGTSHFQHSYKYLLLFPYAIISAFSFCIVNLLLPKKNRKWTIGLELFKTFAILLLISSLSYIYNTMFLSKVNLSFENYLYMFGYTSALGLPTAAIYILARYIYLNNKNKSHTNIITPVKELHTETESCIVVNKTKLNIVADYANFNLEIEQEDFIYAESADNYCTIHFYDNGVMRKEMIRISLTKLLGQIQNDSIKKVHRSFIVNLKKITKLKGNTSGYKISIENSEKELIISRNHISSIVPVLKNFGFRP